MIGGAVAVAILVAGGIYMRGASDQRSRDELKEAIDYRDTRERIDHAISKDRTPDDVLERLRQHAR
ncbi:hypothetical protein QO034_13345 [Sedimentitalea sp. JM2-8]|uniref:Uncharacterized protein n=1 Tax=Sedimentitalea xiamensis TaxID=3050037 RepID=A0ABT7FG31_9RHOB|nr:hypothetical protein [Sedimentitalea xiamensis]